MSRLDELIRRVLTIVLISSWPLAPGQIVNILWRETNVTWDVKEVEAAIEVLVKKKLLGSAPAYFPLHPIP